VDFSLSLLPISKKSSYFPAHALQKPGTPGTSGMRRVVALQGTPPPSSRKYAHLAPGSGDCPANRGHYRRYLQIPARQAAFEKPMKYRSLSCQDGGTYDY